MKENAYPVIEILFRGKTKVIAGSPYNNGKSDGEWVKGYAYNDVGCWKIRQFETAWADYVPYEVDPETIGQYTGLTDSKGEKIFGGDIIKFGDIVGVINYNEGCYCVKTNKPDWKSRNNPAIDIIMNEYPNEVVIIGNVHDNPELLKEGEK